MLKLTAPDGSVEWRYIPIFNYRIGEIVIFDVAIVADRAHSTALLAVSKAARLSISADGGGTWTPLGTDVTEGYDLGSFTPWQKKPYKMKYETSQDIREELIGFLLGEGT